jgi:hypothetical protein
VDGIELRADPPGEECQGVLLALLWVGPEFDVHPDHVEAGTVIAHGRPAGPAEQVQKPWSLGRLLG